MTAGIVIMFVLVVVVAVPLGLREVVGLGDRAADRGFAIVRRAVLPTALLLAISFALTPGIMAATLALPWLMTAGASAILALLAAGRDAQRTRLGIRHAIWAALTFLAVGAGNAVADRLGVQPFGFSPTIVLLTAVHFTVAGFVLVIAGTMAFDRTRSSVTGAAVGAVIAGMPVTALGFFGVPTAALLGALLVSLGGIGIALGTIRSANTFQHPTARVAGWLAGLSLLVSMPLAMAYAFGAFVGTPWLDLPTMARTHGVINVLGFALPAMIAWTLAGRSLTAPSDMPGGPGMTKLMPAPSAGRMRSTLVVLLAIFTVGNAVFAVHRTTLGPDDAAHISAGFLLLIMPAIVAVIGASRRSMPLVAAAGAMSLLPAVMTGLAVIPFAGFLAIGGLDRGPLPATHELARGAAVAVLGILAWFLPWAVVEPGGLINGIGLAIATVMILVTIAFATVASFPDRR